MHRSASFRRRRLGRADPNAVRCTDRFAARARTATPEEKPRLWRLMTSVFPLYDTYQAKSDRDIPLVILEDVTPRGEPGDR
ncbi:nitroreductase/quinone reductase family protein [Actinoallomurus acanthiterrae]